jgi:hypothetical protein
MYLKIFQTFIQGISACMLRQLDIRDAIRLGNIERDFAEGEIP